MASEDELEWTNCDELLDDIFKNPKVQLPQLIKLSDKFSSYNGEETLEGKQTVVIHAKKTVAKLEGTDAKGNLIRLPVDCPYTVTLKLPPGQEKNFASIEVLAKTEPLPKFVEVTKIDGLESVSVGDRLKVVIAEKTGGVTSYIHFRSALGKHVKISVDQNISFKLAVNDASEQLLSKIAEKSRELPVAAEFFKSKDTPKTHINLGVFTITKGFTENIVIASAKKSNCEYAVVFPLNSKVNFQVNTKLKLAKDEQYRKLCSNFSSVDVSLISEYLNMVNPIDKETRYIAKYLDILKLVGEQESDHSDSESETNQETISGIEKQSSKEEEPPILVHQEQRDIVKKELKEKERLAKLEKDRLKAEKRREKKERKEKEKEQKKKKKSLSSQKSTTSEQYTEDLYILPESLSAPTSPTTVDYEDSNQPQWALQLISKVKNVKDRTKSLGFRPKKRTKLQKQDIAFNSTDCISDVKGSETFYTGLSGENDDFSDGLYETLPCDMAYESLDLLAQARRSLAPKLTENNGDSGFDEVDQAKIKVWRDSMQPPPLPGNHPHQRRIPSDNNDDIYEVAVDSSGATGNADIDALQSFYDVIQHSTREISTWGMEDVASCLLDLKLGKYKKTFEESQVDGHLLLDLDESVLKDLGLTFFEARKLRKFVYGWRPDAMRPESYPKLKGFESTNPSDWTEKDVIAHLRVIDIIDVADFCGANQVNGELLKDICVDDTIMNSIITTRDRKLKSVKIKNYVIDQWRPKQKGEGNYTSYTPVNKGNLTHTVSHSPSQSPNGRGSPVTRKNSSPYDTQRNNRKVSESNSTPGVGKKVIAGDAPLIARMKQQLEENKNSWQKKGI